MALAQQIYQATYSSVPVYEVPCQGVAVMRRKADSWLNATQILKVAGFDKPQRTRVLEREVQKGTHEKIQGGYGKYQGTWVPLERGVALAKQYGVDNLLAPIFDYVPSSDSPPLAPKHITATPVTNRKAKRPRTDSDVPHVQPVVKRAAAERANKARKAADEVMSKDANSDDEQSMIQAHLEKSVSVTPVGSEIGDDEYVPNNTLDPRRRLQQPPVEGFSYHNQAKEHESGPMHYARQILDFFVLESSQMPHFLLRPPPDFDPNVVIDDDGHTALHWACAMGRIKTVKLLLNAGGDIFRTNALGQTALMRSVMFTNNYDLRTFPELFELLLGSTINVDKADRTVFHYIVDIALQKGKTHAARYYMETALNHLTSFGEPVTGLINFQDEEGETALTLSARARSKRLVKILLDHGADPKIVNRDGKSAEDYILEDEQFREQEPSVPDQTTGWSFPSQIHTSETGKYVSQKVIVQIADLLEGVAKGFDHELAEGNHNRSYVISLKGNVETEVQANLRLISDLEKSVLKNSSLEAQETRLTEELDKKLRQGLNVGFKTWSTSQLNTPSFLTELETLETDKEKRILELRQKIQQHQVKTDALVKEFTQLQKSAGTGTQLGKYKRLIALGCDSPLDKVDEIIDALSAEESVL